MGELQVVAGVEPPAQHVDRAADLLQRGVGDDVAVRFEVGRGVHGCLGVVEVRGLAAGLAGDHVRPVPLHLVEGDAVGDRLAVEVCRVGDGELRRGSAGAAADRDVVAARCAYPGEGDRVDRLVLVVPPAPAGTDLAGEHLGTGRVHHGEGGAADRAGHHEVRLLGVARQVTDLVHADQAGGRRAGRGRQRQGANREPGDTEHGEGTR